MKENKEFKSNANYFQKGETLRWISIGLLVLTALLYFFGMGYISYIIMSVGIPLAALLFVLSTFGRSSEADIDAYVKTHTENVGYRTDDPQEIEKRLLKNISVQTAEGYARISITRSSNAMSSKRGGTSTIGAPWNRLERLYLKPE